MKEIYSLYISLAALVVSAFSLGWNFYKDVILKPRLRVIVAIIHVTGSGRTEGPYINVSGVNHGPGPIIVNGMLGQKVSWLPFRRKGSKYFYVMEGYDNPLSDRLPKRLEPGDSVNQYLPCNNESFLSIDPSHIGLRDTFGRMHWASRRSLRSAKSEFFKKFEKKQES